MLLYIWVSEPFESLQGTWQIDLALLIKWLVFKEAVVILINQNLSLSLNTPGWHKVREPGNQVPR